MNSANATASARGMILPEPIQCVPFAREVSGINLFGDAYSWWDSAEGQYQRGISPEKGAVLVLSRSEKLRHGHVAVVNKVLTSRQIDVTHANWGSDQYSRRIVRSSMRVVDVSPRNDWSQLRFWNPEAGSFGQIYPAKGFIYNNGPRS
ncbi:MAG: CHAP domain-containing protein [Alphaproteobacteria bacterium]